MSSYTLASGWHMEGSRSHEFREHSRVCRDVLHPVQGSDGTHSHCVVKRVFDLVLETKVNDALLSCAV